MLIVVFFDVIFALKRTAFWSFVSYKIVKLDWGVLFVVTIQHNKLWFPLKFNWYNVITSGHDEFL